jgi:arginine repressor
VPPESQVTERRRDSPKISAVTERAAVLHRGGIDPRQATGRWLESRLAMRFGPAASSLERWVMLIDSMEAAPMSEDSELQRRRLAAVDDMLKKCEPLPDHEKLMAILKWMGCPVLQSNVSRDLKDEGAVGSERGGPLPSRVEEAEASPFRKVQSLILDAVPVGTCVIFMKTRKGAGLKVAAAIEASHWEDLFGIVAGIDSVLLLTENKPCHDRLMQCLKFFAALYGEAGVDPAAVS